MQRAAGWGEGLSFRVLFALMDRHPTPSRISLRSMRADPPPPGQGYRIWNFPSLFYDLGRRRTRRTGASIGIGSRTKRNRIAKGECAAH